MNALVFAAILAVAAAAPRVVYKRDVSEILPFQTRSFEQKPLFRILSDSRSFDPSGRYYYSYETENKIKAEEQGDVVNEGTKDQSAVVKGSYQFVAPDGQLYAVSYTADESGFHPEGAHLPVGPAIPEAILKSLEYNSAHSNEQ